MAKLLTLVITMFATIAAIAGESTHFIQIQSLDSCSVRVIVETPEMQTAKADVLFFIGYGDRADNHSPLFSLLSNNGYRVISFDYPSHGETQCGSLNYHNYSSLIKIAQEVEEKTRISNSIPLILGGWSTGGLLAVRIAQSHSLEDRIPQKMFLLAPGVSVYPLVGGDGIIRQETLLSNSNPPHRGPIQPISPLLTPFFSMALITNSILVQHSSLPSNLETFLIVGSDTLDMYAKTIDVRVWYRNQKMMGSKITAVQCFNSRHEIDNEKEPIGQMARNSILSFLENRSVTESLINRSICDRMH